MNVEAMTNVFLKTWKISFGLTIREMGEILFVFYFGNELENDRVLKKQPWSFNKSMLVLNEFDGFTNLRMSTWVDVLSKCKLMAFRWV